MYCTPPRLSRNLVNPLPACPIWRRLAAKALSPAGVQSGPQRRRRGAAVRRPTARRSEPLCHQVDLALQQPEVACHRSVAAHDVRVTAAEPAEAVAEGDVEVKRQRRLRRDLVEPARMGLGADAGVEMRRGRIARATRHGPVVPGQELRLHQAALCRSQHCFALIWIKARPTLGYP